MVEHLADCDGNGSIDCPECGGESGHHDCGEDCCCCLDTSPNVECLICHGSGRIHCPACAEATPSEDIEDSWTDLEESWEGDRE